MPAFKVLIAPINADELRCKTFVDVPSALRIVEVKNKKTDKAMCQTYF